MDHEEQAIAGEKFREIRIVAFAGNDFVHGVGHGFEALKLLNLADDGGLTDVDRSLPAAEQAQEVQQTDAGR